MNIKAFNAIATKVWNTTVSVPEDFGKITTLFTNDVVKSHLPKDNVETSIKLLEGIYDLSKNENDAKKQAALLHKLNKEVLVTVYISGNELTAFDVFYYVFLHASMVKFNDKDRFIFCNITRWFNYVQNTVFLNNGQLDLVPISTTPPPPEPPKPKAKDAAAGDKKVDEKKAGDAAAAPAAAGKKGGSGRESNKTVEAPKPEDVSRFEIRVGKIVEVAKHADADSLYVEKIDLGESTGPRTIVSGLVNYIPIDQVQDRMVLVLCNLKPRNMKGVKSEGMVLCGSGEGKSTVEFVEPPATAKIGERVVFASYPGEFDKALTKPELIDVVLKELKTNGDRVATWKGEVGLTSAGPCTCKTLANVNIA
ncbi:endothelial monocyte-activating polypeptide II precursor pro-EMAP II family protein [Cavenderia fasciculata]|uniref:Endothelial monocyte-activating polypeptide II pro-EMAP II family protein n=1 Tax=Cavenderia fasciculata TaxID=261658 RepID=F4PZ72_CACFS|nr:endothelial monocyte-activating polypeptide II precursor pro-EMAP II family protein [Cavenderia fasciculata]EGG19101.1 endothelial monocyte-activating polypeptide II precursor pro-EMAP II family protein [Cavenderia fasciculata]|eukprot:XP_004366734.1 endothelial monocyte-activating polypeptide II precursor pro-EMAP II family protein [Cavenderia fasciculata]